jgi:hypothetical protein
MMVVSARMSDYDLDFYAWTQRQGSLLRRIAARERVNDADLDWPNIAEEIETLGRSERAALRSHIANIIEHLIKLQASPATEPRAGWRETIARARCDVEELLQESPSLRPQVANLVVKALPKAQRFAAMALERHDETARAGVATITYSEDQVLGEWFPETP